ncbi:hypothetical protein [Paenibacillus alvei]|uniref:Uncharacterized protein n=1 Tax=Paenibacillus alvei TaxID=44250 RepID=A0A383RH94_PAEAL|nr:hypothetical protein [Paenibacillus alvei]SYX86340.1 conserved protein of unknown function [Paenibacillus alvei]
MRTPVFELHIRPMIRAIDREHMRFAFDLWDYDQIVQHADDVAARVAVDMPPTNSGGPWPDEWVQLFRRWMTTGFKRLELGSAQYTWNQSTTAVTLQATGTYPAAGYKGWLQLESETDTEKTYVLYFEAPDNHPGGPPEDFNIRERYSATDNRTIFIRDNAGTHQIH